MLEYAAPVWSPYLIKDIADLGKVQRKSLATRFKAETWRNELRTTLQLIKMANTREAERISISGSML